MSWETKKFIDFILLQRGHDLTKEQIKPGLYPVVTSTSIMGYHNAFKVEGPGVITGRSGTIGEVQYIEENYWPHNTSLYVKDFKGNYPKFVFYFMKNFGTDRAKSGSAVPTLNRNSLSNIEIKVPDIKTQHKIADILSSYDDLIENNKKQIKLLEEAAQRLYKEWFVDLRFPGHDEVEIVDGVPVGWDKTTMDKICDSVGGGTPSTKVEDYYRDGNIKWVTPTDITRNDGLILLDTEKKITQEGLKNSSAKMVPPNTILMTSRASVGYFGICEYEVCTNQGFISCIPNQENYRWYLLYNLLNRVDEIRQKASGSTFLEISKRSFRELIILKPNDKALDAFDTEIISLLQQMKVLKKQIVLLQNCRDSLLPKLMSGKIEV